MLRPRIIPCLLVHNGGLVKTVKFKSSKYVGDPLNAVRIFNEKEVDELLVLDIDASVRGKEPDYRLIESLASECRMPLCYGGGIKGEGQAEKIIGLGVEKVALSSALVEDPSLAGRISAVTGKQSVVFVLDVKKNAFGRYTVVTYNGRKNCRRDPFELARTVESQGIGEIVVNSIDRDGTMVGYDGGLAERMRASVSTPMTVLGGAGSLSDVQALIDRFKTVGAAAGSLFVFKGKYRAVLINYPSVAERRSLTSSRSAA